MSEARLELVEPCEHGWEGTHCLRDAEGSCPHRRDGSFGPDVECFCPSGSRRVLSEGEFLFLERPDENKRWPDWVVETCLDWARADTTDVLDLLDMLVESAQENAPATRIRPGAGQT